MLLFQPLLKKFSRNRRHRSSRRRERQRNPLRAPTPAVTLPAPTVPVSAVVTKQADERNRNRHRERSLPHHLHQPRRPGQILDPEEIRQRHQNGPLDLVNSAAAEKYGYPLSLWTYDEDLREQTEFGALRGVARRQADLAGDVTFEYSDQDLDVRKTFSFDDTYVVKVETSVTYKGSPVAALPAWPSGFGDQTTPAFYAAGLIDLPVQQEHRASADPLRLLLVLEMQTISGGGNHPRPLPLGRPDRSVFRRRLYPRRSRLVVHGHAAQLMPILARPAEARVERSRER